MSSFTRWGASNPLIRRVRRHANISTLYRAPILGEVFSPQNIGQASQSSVQRAQASMISSPKPVVVGKLLPPETSVADRDHVNGRGSTAIEAAIERATSVAPVSAPFEATPSLQPEQLQTDSVPSIDESGSNQSPILSRQQAEPVAPQVTTDQPISMGDNEFPIQRQITKVEEPIQPPVVRQQSGAEPPDTEASFPISEDSSVQTESSSSSSSLSTEDQHFELLRNTWRAYQQPEHGNDDVSTPTVAAIATTAPKSSPSSEVTVQPKVATPVQAPSIERSQTAVELSAQNRRTYIQKKPIEDTNSSPVPVHKAPEQDAPVEQDVNQPTIEPATEQVTEPSAIEQQSLAADLPSPLVVQPSSAVQRQTSPKAATSDTEKAQAEVSSAESSGESTSEERPDSAESAATQDLPTKVVSERIDRGNSNEETVVNHQQVSLEDAWPVQRTAMADVDSFVNDSAAPSSTDVAQINDKQHEALNNVFTQVNTAQPTESTVHVITPRRPRPAPTVASPSSQPVVTNSLQRSTTDKSQITATAPELSSESGESINAVTGEVPESTDGNILAPAQLLEQNSSVETEFGLLPSDLWQMIDEPVPTVESSPVAEINLMHKSTPVAVDRSVQKATKPPTDSLAPVDPALNIPAAEQPLPNNREHSIPYIEPVQELVEPARKVIEPVDREPQPTVQRSLSTEALLPAKTSTIKPTNVPIASNIPESNSLSTVQPSLESTGVIQDRSAITSTEFSEEPNGEHSIPANVADEELLTPRVDPSNVSTTVLEAAPAAPIQMSRQSTEVPMADPPIVEQQIDTLSMGQSPKITNSTEPAATIAENSVAIQRATSNNTDTSIRSEQASSEPTVFEPLQRELIGVAPIAKQAAAISAQNGGSTMRQSNGKQSGATDIFAEPTFRTSSESVATNSFLQRQPIEEELTTDVIDDVVDDSSSELSAAERDAPQPEVDTTELARQVYAEIRKRLITERERLR